MFCLVCTPWTVGKINCYWLVKLTTYVACTKLILCAACRRHQRCFSTAGTGQPTKPESKYQPPAGRKVIMSTYTVIMTKLPCARQLVDTTTPVLVQSSIGRANKLAGSLFVWPGFSGMLISVLKCWWENKMTVKRDITNYEKREDFGTRWHWKETSCG